MTTPAEKPPSPKRFLSAADVAEELGVSLTSAYEIMRQAGLQPIRGLVKVSRENLEAWLQAEREKRDGDSGSPRGGTRPTTAGALRRAQKRRSVRACGLFPSPTSSPAARRGKKYAPAKV